MDTNHPILVIGTSQMCPHCVNMRGDGWPSESQRVSIPGGHKWNINFFKSVLTAGKNDGIQRVEIFAIHYYQRASNPQNLIEFSIFSLTKTGKLLVRNFKQSPRGEGIMHASYEEPEIIDAKTEAKVIGDALKPEWKYNPDIDFEKYKRSWLPVDSIGQFSSYFPFFMYFSSTIWWANILQGSPLYCYIPGIKLVHQANDHTKYIIDRSTDPNPEFKDPIKVVEELLVIPDVLYYPPDHGQIYMRIQET